MKYRQVILLAIFLTILTNVSSQQMGNIDDKGIIIGYQNTKYEVSMENSSIEQYQNNGFFVSFFADIELSEKFYVQPELLYSMTFNQGTNYKKVAIPIMLKYFIINKVSLQVGSLFDILFDNSLNRNSGINLMGGIGTKITEDFSILIRYSYPLTGRGYDTENDFFSYNFNYLQVGVAYRLWEK